MAESPKQNAILHKLYRSYNNTCVRFQRKLHRFAYTSAVWKTQNQYFSLRSNNDQEQYYHEFIVRFRYVFSVFIIGLRLWPNPTKENCLE